MSLKAVHLIFVTVLSSLCFGTAVWKLRLFRESGGASDLIWGIGALLTGLAVLVYGKYFLKKLKKFSYL